MKALNQIKKIIYSSTFIFTVTVFIMTLIYIFTQDETVTHTKAIPIDRYLPLYLFSLALGALDHLLVCKKMNLVLRVALHFAGGMTAVFVVFVLLFGLGGQTSYGKLSAMLVFAVIYAVLLCVCFLIRKGFSRLCAAVSNAAQRKTEDITDKQ